MISFMCITSSKPEDVIEQILIYCSLIIKCPNVFRYQRGLTCFHSETKKKTETKWVF